MDVVDKPNARQICGLIKDCSSMKKLSVTHYSRRRGKRPPTIAGVDVVVDLFGVFDEIFQVSSERLYGSKLSFASSGGYKSLSRIILPSFGHLLLSWKD